ncbi:MAG: cytochrome C assembly family protein, partial [Gammaproteobacteria bacterium]
MNIAVFAVLAIVFYLAAAMRIARGIVERARGGSAATRPALILALLALALHAAVLYQGILTGSGLNLGIFNTVSLVAWVVAGVVVVASLVAPVENLALVLLPSAGLGIGLELLFPNERLLLASAPLGLRLHVVLSVTAYSLLTIAALQAVVIAVEERLL